VSFPLSKIRGIYRYSYNPGC